MLLLDPLNLNKLQNIFLNFLINFDTFFRFLKFYIVNFLLFSVAPGLGFGFLFIDLTTSFYQLIFLQFLIIKANTSFHFWTFFTENVCFFGFSTYLFFLLILPINQLFTTTTIIFLKFNFLFCHLLLFFGNLIIFFVVAELLAESLHRYLIFITYLTLLLRNHFNNPLLLSTIVDIQFLRLKFWHFVFGFQII